MDKPDTKLVYGNWIRKRVLWRLTALSLASGGLMLLPMHPWLRLAAGVLFAVFFVSLIFPLYAYYAFSPRGGNFQETLFDRIVGQVGEHKAGEILDVGAGNGVLAVKLALSNPQSRVTAIDYWGDDWEYASKVCEENARRAGVENSTSFLSGDAAKLEFPDRDFDVVVSNLTFHEVKTAEDPRSVVAESLRVVKPGGTFVFVDYFFQTKLYGSVADFEQFIRTQGVRAHELLPIGQVVDLSLMLRHPRVLGKVGMLSGIK